MIRLVRRVQIVDDRRVSVGTIAFEQHFSARADVAIHYQNSESKLHALPKKLHSLSVGGDRITLS